MAEQNADSGSAHSGHTDSGEPSRPRRAATEQSRRDRLARGGFGRAAGWTVLGAILPGLGLIKAGRRVLGTVILALFIAIPVGLGIWALTNRDSLMALVVNTTFLTWLPLGIAIFALIWVTTIVASHVALRPRRLSGVQRGAGSALVGVLAFAVAAPMAVAASYSSVQAGLVSTVFQSGTKSKSQTRPTIEPGNDPWKNKPRLNVLLLGGDGGKGREGVRTDTVILASIDTATGNTTMFSLPRNTARMPFPKDSPLHKVYPNGFYDGYNGDDAEFMLNAMYRNLPEAHPGILGETDNLGADALKLSVGEALGLKVDYYALVNLQGFTKLINALGGITVNINEYVAIGGQTDRGILPDGYLSPGPDQHLQGRDALWFARGRYGSNDFDRMDRQRCVMNAVIRQANPQTVLTRYEAIAKASKTIVYTDIPQETLPAMLDLALRVRDAKTRSVVFKSGEKGFVSANPDFPAMRKRVQSALDETNQTPKPSASSSATSSTKPKSSKTPTAASENADETCAYDAKAAEEAKKNPPYWVKAIR